MNSRTLLGRTSHAALLCAIAILGTAFGQTSQSVKPTDLGDFSGLYTFVHEGESVQITLDELPTPAKPKVPVTGYVTRLGGPDTDRDQTFDLMFKSGSLDGQNISFTTKTIHGISYEFSGTVRRGDAKSKDKEGYVVIEGTLVENSVDKSGKPRSQRRELTMKSFPNLDETDVQK
jgi:hypothetical protein